MAGICGGTQTLRDVDWPLSLSFLVLETKRRTPNVLKSTNCLGEIMHNKSDYFKPLEECSRVSVDGEYSEYITILAISRMPDYFTDDQLLTEINTLAISEDLMHLVELGLVNMSWDEKQEDLVFYAV